MKTLFFLKTLKDAKKGDGASQYQIGLCYENGDEGVQQDSVEAMYWFRLASNNGYFLAQNKLADCYFDGINVKQNYREAVRLYTLAAEQGYEGAQYKLGLCYEQGLGVKQDYKTAYKWYEKSSKRVKKAQKKLATLDVIIEANETPEGQFNYGYKYYTGDGVRKNYKIALEYFSKAAKNNNANAQYMLGYCYYYGSVVEKNYEIAAKNFHLAAEQGHAEAQCYLGICYYYGRGVKKNYKEEVKWYRKSAEQGNKNAQYYLGICYEVGQGVEKSYNDTLKWLRMASDQGHEEAQKRLDEFLKKTHQTDTSKTETTSEAPKKETTKKVTPKKVVPQNVEKAEPIKDKKPIQKEEGVQQEITKEFCEIEEQNKQNKKFIFISYSHSDKDEVLPMIKELEQKYNVWYDNGIDPGTEWAENIAYHVENCSFFITCMTKNYLKSINCTEELNYAREFNKNRLMVYFENVELTGGMKMRHGYIQNIHKYVYQNEQEFYEKLFTSKGIEDCKR